MLRRRARRAGGAVTHATATSRRRPTSTGTLAYSSVVDEASSDDVFVLDLRRRAWRAGPADRRPSEGVRPRAVTGRRVHRLPRQPARRQRRGRHLGDARRRDRTSQPHAVAGGSRTGRRPGPRTDASCTRASAAAPASRSCGRWRPTAPTSAWSGRAGASTPRPSPDGRFVCSAASGGRYDLVVVDGDGDRTDLTSTPETEFGAAWSPDGEWIAFGRDTGERWELLRIRADGTDEQVLASEGVFPTWGPDGLLAWSGLDGITIANPDGSGSVALDQPGEFLSWRGASP